MSNVGIEVIAPVFGIMVAGFLAARCRVFGSESSAALSRFVFYVSLPALTFISLARVPVAEVFDWPLIGAFGGSCLILFAVGYAVARLVFPDTPTARALHALCAMFSSTGYLGLPLVVMAYGDKALIPGIVGTVITGAIFLPLTVLLAEIDKGRGAGRMILAPLLDVLKTPMLLAAVAGVLASFLGVPIPRPFGAFCDILGGAFIPCALFSAGLFVANCTVKGEVREVGWLVAAKLFLHPAVAWWLAYKVLDLDPMKAAIAVLLAALPTGVPAFVLAQQYKAFVMRANAIIVISTAISVVTLSALLVVLVP